MADPEMIYNWRRLDDRVTTSGQPTEPQLADIKALGVRHIVNLGLHTHEKALPNEAASVNGLGMGVAQQRQRGCDTHYSPGQLRAPVSEAGQLAVLWMQLGL